MKRPFILLAMKYWILRGEAYSNDSKQRCSKEFSEMLALEVDLSFSIILDFFENLVGHDVARKLS